MNYIRGAVNAISAPYHYYKDLPPLNPSTLTGAIDVIVIQRPTDTGDTELVKVSVNGHPIPFDMKIGEAGEAFFVFETEEDVPNDLITSPILQPTRPEETSGRTLDMKGAELEAKLELDDEDLTGLQRADASSQRVTGEHEPDFLDLDAQPSQEERVDHNQHFAELHPSSNEHLDDGIAVPGLPSPPLTPTYKTSDLTPEMVEQERRVDAALKNVREATVVEFDNEVAFDMQGYHSQHDREMSDRTFTSSDSDKFTFPSLSKTRSSTPPPVQELDLSDLGSPRSLPSSMTFPMFRAVSEPLPDTEEHSPAMASSQQHASSSKARLPPLTPVQEYSWEWGAFPQPSPMTATFPPKSSQGRIWAKGKGKASDLRKSGPNESQDVDIGRSKSVPPELDGSPTQMRKLKELVEEYDEPDDEDVDGTSFGHGGVLRPTQNDPCRFALQIDGRRVVFELSIVHMLTEEPDGALSEPDDDTGSGRRSRHRRGGSSSSKIFDGRDEVEAARLFSEGKIDYASFMDNDDIVSDPGLVISWAGNQYITRSDCSPLMDALVVWRNSTLRQQALNLASPPSSPVFDEDTSDIRPVSPSLSEDEQQHEERHHQRSKSEPPEKVQGKPTSSSWVRWWNRSSKKAVPKILDEELASSQTERPVVRGTSSAPASNVVAAPEFLRSSPKDIPPAESAPALPSTPVQPPAKTIAPADLPTIPPPVSKRYAKTLRLSSDQLKSLNLKTGANTITFSLSASGAIACTARIFVWDSTDFVVVSDIDGTITKSDGLGHVFAMIGRDWTHLGVAKLYTDITRNGYKIMYLTSRAIGQADATRAYLEGIKQNNYQLPEGPVIMSPDRLMTSLHREVILRKPEVFKMACLRDIQRLFGEASRNPFYAGFGNRITDALSYRSVNVPSARIFTIDSTGEVKMELLELAGYKSSYIHMTDLVDQMFPPIHRKWAPEYTDFNYWKVPVQEFPLPDFSPPSPTLSARSDTSTLARLRNFSLGRQNSTPASRMSPPPEGKQDQDRGRSSHLRQMSSLERLGSTLGWSRSTSPATSYGSDDEDEVNGQGRRKRERTRSMTSMPGTLDEMHFGMDEEEEEAEFYQGSVGVDGEVGYLTHEPEEAGEEDFDEDIMVAGEMKNGTSATFEAPAAPGEEYIAPPQSALHTTDGDAFNVDPTVPYLSSIPDSAQPQTSTGPSRRGGGSGSNRFSRWTSLARRAMSKHAMENAERRAEEGRPLALARSPSPPAVPAASVSSPSDTHTIPNSDFEGTTAVSHDNHALPVIGSPVYIEPQPTVDYAKMEESGHASITSFASCMAYIKNFFRELNSLPWVAERVTVDYVPGEVKSRRQARLHRLQRPLSWYEDTPHSLAPTQLFSDTTSPSSLPMHQQLPQASSAPPLNRSIPSEQRHAAPTTPLQAPTISPQVIWEFLPTGKTSTAPFATVVQSNWSTENPVTPLTTAYIPHEPQPTASEPWPPDDPWQSVAPQNPMPSIARSQPAFKPLHPASAPPSAPPQALSEVSHSVPKAPAPSVTVADGVKWLFPEQPTYPSGYVQSANVDNLEAQYPNQRFHPRPENQDTTATATTAPPSSVREHITSLPPSSAPTPHYSQPTAPIPQMASSPVVPPAATDSWNGAASILPTTSVAFASPDRPLSTAPVHASVTSPQPSVRIVPQQSSRPPSVAPSRRSRAPSATPGPAMSQTLSRPPSVAPSHASHMSYASRTPTVRPSQSRPSSVAPSHRSSARQATPRSLASGAAA
ncbi:hypothetical protein H0H93_006733 [Arthromyces matolae]|nr:hypothetical protein H0H93_006733 [Arthromyces matolae]